MLLGKVQADDITAIFLEEASKMLLRAVTTRVFGLINDDRWLGRE